VGVTSLLERVRAPASSPFQRPPAWADTMVLTK